MTNGTRHLPAAAAGLVFGAAIGAWLRQLPDRAATVAQAQVASVYGALYVGAAIRQGDRRSIVLESATAVAYSGTALTLALRRPRALPVLLGAHALWDLRHAIDDQPATPAPWYPAFCAGVDLAIGVSARRGARERLAPLVRGHEVS